MIRTMNAEGIGLHQAEAMRRSPLSHPNVTLDEVRGAIANGLLPADFMIRAGRAANQT